MYPLAQPAVADLFDDILHSPEADFDLIKSRIPSLFGVSDKATYLAYRSLGLKPSQALQAMEYTEDLLEEWKVTDPDFLIWESTYITRLQNTLATDMVTLGFMRNMAMFVAMDSVLIRKASIGQDLLDKREHDYLLKIRGQYGAGELLSLQKVLHPGLHEDNINITLSFGDQPMIEGVQSKYVVEGQVEDNDSISFQHSVNNPLEQENPMRSLQSGD